MRRFAFDGVNFRIIFLKKGIDKTVITVYTVYAQ